jgi:hypothetical protein
MRQNAGSASASAVRPETILKVRQF